MCLYIGYKKPFIAKSDIIVYKYVNQDKGKYFTACRDYPVNINEVMKPSRNEDVWTCFKKYGIEGGFIHACTTTFNNGFGSEICLMAIIRKGTEFYIQDDLKQVAARELYITGVEITGNRTTDLTEYLEDALKNSESNNDGIKVGYYLLSDGNFISPFKYKEGTIIGMVAFFDKNGKPVSIGVKPKKLPWIKRIFNNKVSSNISPEDTVKDMDGTKHTRDILNKEAYNPDNFEAIEYCTKYSTEGTKSGDWYLPAIGECVKIAQNILIINMSLSKVGFDIFDFSALWSSSERSVDSISYTWHCYISDGYCCYYELGGSSYICPCIVSI